jgi:Domain of unknown function (DUF1963)
MFQLVRLSVTHEEIRRHFTKPMYELCVVPEERAWVQHQILGHFKSSQEARPINDAHVSLFMLSYDIFPGFRICDVGELRFFIDPEDLRSRNFGLVEAQMQGG